MLPSRGPSHFYSRSVWHAACRRTIRSDGGVAHSTGRLSTAATCPHRADASSLTTATDYDGPADGAAAVRDRGAAVGARRFGADRVIGHAISPHREQDAREAAGERHHRNALPASVRNALRPAAKTGRPGILRAPHAPGGLDEQGLDMGWALRSTRPRRCCSPELYSRGTRPR